MSQTNAKLIALEGPDGSGKSTITKYLEEKLNSLGIPSVRTHEVGGTPIGSELRNICFNKRNDEVLYSAARLLLIYAARIQHVNCVIAPNLESGINVVTDRFNMSTMVYDGVLGNQTLLMSQIEEHVVTMLPNVVIYLDVDPEIASKRMEHRGKVDNTLYKGNKDIAIQVHNAYRKVMAIWKTSDKYKNIPIFIVDAKQNESGVKAQIDLVINTIFNLEGAKAMAVVTPNSTPSVLSTPTEDVNYVTVVSIVDNPAMEQVK